jgi:hypothetical protein
MFWHHRLCGREFIRAARLKSRPQLALLNLREVILKHIFTAVSERNRHLGFASLFYAPK